MPAQLRSASAVLECWLAGNRVNTSVCNVLQVVWGKEMGKEPLLLLLVVVVVVVQVLVLVVVVVVAILLLLLLSKEAAAPTVCWLLPAACWLPAAGLLTG